MEKRLPLKVKLCYSVGSMGKVVQGLAASTFLLYFYTEILGIHSGIAASIIFFCKLFDIINDPLIGALVDRNKSKEGKCRAYLKYFAIPTGVCIFLCFFVPFEGAVLQIAYIIITYGILATISSFIQIPMNTLMGRMSQDEQQRSHLNQLSGIVSLIGNYVVVSWTFPVAAFSGNSNLRKGFLFVGLFYGMVYAASYMVTYFGTKGYEIVENSLVSGESKKASGVSLKETVRGLLANKVWLCIGLYYLFDMIASTLESTAMVFYFQYNLKDTGLLSTYSLIAMICSFLIFCSLHLYTKRLGNAGTTLLGCCLSISGDVLRLILHDSCMGVLYAGWILSSIGSSLVAGTVLLNLFDAKLYGEWKYGVKCDAVLMSGFTLATKIGMAVGSAAVGWFLLLVPYTEGAAVQPQSVLNLLFLLNTALPAGAFLLVLLLAIPVYKNEKKLPEMKKELEEIKHESI